MSALFSFHVSELQKPSAALQISGPDANTYLQGQVTQDVRISVAEKCYGLWLSQKGKVLADSYILRRTSDEHLVWSPRTGPDVLRARLEAYLIADEVEIADESTGWKAIACWGPAAEGFVGKVAPHAPDLPSAGFLELDGALVFRGRHSRQPNFTWLCRENAVVRWCEALRAAGGIEVDANAAELERIRAGIPAVPDDIGAADLPNEGGLDIDAISYTKGCYLGQEVMARLKNLGQVRRRLHRVRGPGVPPAHGAELFQQEKRVGEIRSAAREADGFVAFAMLSLVSLDASAPLALTAGGPANVEIVAHG